ncbi:hypothetical protein [Hymenobacter perfusus]|uniref:Glycosyltransferase RgtA/B/C/D-like domain-containing protein n=1 Tax=Hymenobacter perfusus TaxID=1236770 RepID=A0A3R9P7W4_9BACT|nr:hypothetical protein [Hymenobacter perfusus]RSK46148.1 hypothetical protein EI293_02965 [Hymenobacter perfusus]
MATKAAGGNWPSWLRRIAAYTLLILVATGSFWFSPAPLTEDEYCGTYLHLGPHAGFTANCDGFVYMDNARQPARLLEPRAVRQSRPLFILLGTAVGYPVTWAVQGLQSSGLLPAQVVQKLPAKYQPLLGFYIGYVLLNYAVLLAALLLFRHLYYRLTAGQGSRLVLAVLLIFLVSNQITKAFFWTVHQQMFTFLVPLLLLYVALQLRESGRWRAQLPGLAALGGLLALVYGSFVLGLPVLLYGAWLQREKQTTVGLLLRLMLLVGLFLLPTLGWIALLKLRGVTYYNHEAEAYGQLVWLHAVWQQPLPDFLQLAGRNLLRFLATLPAIGPFVAVAAGLLLWPRRPERTRFSSRCIGALLLLQTGFLVALGYYKDRLTFMLVPLLLLLVAGVLLRLPGRWVGIGLLAAALGWHAWQVLRYGPFS